MIAYVLRRLGQGVLTIFGVTIITFLLFRAMPGDIAAAHIGRNATQQQRADWLDRHGYNRPPVLNVHRRLVITDAAKGNKPLAAEGSSAVEALALIPADAPGDTGRAPARKLFGRYVARLSPKTPIAELTGKREMTERIRDRSKRPGTGPSGVSTKPAAMKPAAAAKRKTPRPRIHFLLTDGSSLEVDLGGVTTCGELIDRINDHPGNDGRLEAGITDWSVASLLDSQFVDHLKKSVSFQARSLRTNERLTDIIARRAPVSLALTVPAMVIGWLAGMAISCFAAYYRGTILEGAGVLLSVLGMCIPFLAFMIFGQWLMFIIAPDRAYGVFNRSDIYVPILILVAAGLGGSVRLYRTVILDEVNRDYVRTALAKGAPVTTVLFKHVLGNCMLPILTGLILTIPFLIMGSLLVETYFGLPGLGDLMISSINNRDEPIINAMVFLTAVVYTAGTVLTDISYAVFDPRIRLR